MGWNELLCWGSVVVGSQLGGTEVPFSWGGRGLSYVRWQACRQCDSVDVGWGLYVLAGCRIDDCVGGVSGLFGLEG